MKRRKAENIHSSRMGDDEQSTSSSFCFGSVEAAPCLQRELRQMPTASRERAGQDLLGVGEEIEIPLERLDELQERIDSLDDNKAAYDLAMEMSPEYAMDPRLRMAFLRSVDGSAKKASKRFIRHFQTKLELFGREKLVKHIELSDLDDYDLEALRSGGFQVLPTKDRGGRPILFGRYTCMKYRSIDNMLRVLWYLFFCMIEDEEHQASGIVTLGFENGKVPLERFENVEDDDSKFDMHAADGGFDKELARGILRIPTSIPVRFMSFHICADYTHHWQGVFDMVVVTLCKFVRIRLRLHYGSDQEVKYALLTHGIPAEVIPVNPEGDILLTNHYAWIEHRREIEESRR